MLVRIYEVDNPVEAITLADRILHAVEFILREPDRIAQYPEILSSLTEKKLSYRELENAYSAVDSP